MFPNPKNETFFGIIFKIIVFQFQQGRPPPAAAAARDGRWGGGGEGGQG